MSEGFRQIDGDDWENEIIALLGRRYPPGDFIVVPAEDGGDLGMDGVGRDGVVYQCYSPVEPLTYDDRKKKHQSKIYTDLNKLVQRQDEHREFLGNIMVRRWMLIVPKLTSRDIQTYANKRAEEIRKADCSYIASDFEATVSDDSFLATERKALINGVLTKLHIEIPAPDEARVRQWAESTNSIEALTSLRSKLRKLPSVSTDEEVAALEEKYLHRYLMGRDLVANLSTKHAELYETTTRTKRSFELELEMRSELSRESGDVRIQQELNGYKDTLSESVNGDLDDENVVHLVQEAITDWLIRCPLDFPEAAQ